MILGQNRATSPFTSQTVARRLAVIEHWPIRSPALHLLLGAARNDSKQVPRRNDLCPRPGCGKVLEIAGYEVIRSRSLSAFEKNIIVWVRTSSYGFRGSNPNALLVNSLERSGDDVLVATEPGTADNLFVLGINAPADAQLNAATDRKHEYLSGRPEGLQQRRNDYVGVENDPDHEPGCGRESRRAFRAAAISASISSVESSSRPASLALCHDF